MDWCLYFSVQYRYSPLFQTLFLSSNRFRFVLEKTAFSKCHLFLGEICTHLGEKHFFHTPHYTLGIYNRNIDTFRLLFSNIVDNPTRLWNRDQRQQVPPIKSIPEVQY